MQLENEGRVQEDSYAEKETIEFWKSSKERNFIIYLFL